MLYLENFFYPILVVINAMQRDVGFVATCRNLTMSSFGALMWVGDCDVIHQVHASAAMRENIKAHLM